MTFTSAEKGFMLFPSFAPVTLQRPLGTMASTQTRPIIASSCLPAGGASPSGREAADQVVCVPEPPAASFISGRSVRGGSNRLFPRPNRNRERGPLAPEETRCARQSAELAGRRYPPAQTRGRVAPWWSAPALCPHCSYARFPRTATESSTSTPSTQAPDLLLTN
jgi:hypothetical protein